MRRSCRPAHRRRCTGCKRVRSAKWLPLRRFRSAVCRSLTRREVAVRRRERNVVSIPIVTGRGECYPGRSVSDHNDPPVEPVRARTLEDVARLAGVSRNTVSLAIRDSPRVKVETRERVMRIVRETGYRPNFAARALAGRRTTTVGLLRFGSSRMQADSFY